MTTDGDRMHARIVGRGVDLANVPTVSWIGVPMTGSADIAIEVTVPIKDGESDFRAATGVLSLRSASCSIGFDEAVLVRQIGKGYDSSGAANLKLSGELDEPHALRVPYDDALVAFAPDDPAAAVLTGSAPAIDPSPDLDFAAHISSTADNAYIVDRSLFDRLLANPLLAMKAARIVPNIEDGQMAGFMLYGIRPGSVFAALGIENGDQILAVNGEAIRSADKALELHTKLRDAKVLHVEGTRRSQPLALDYTIK